MHAGFMDIQKNENEKRRILKKAVWVKKHL
jgi:hypothetical protein